MSNNSSLSSPNRSLESLRFSSSSPPIHQQVSSSPIPEPQFVSSKSSDHEFPEPQGSPLSKLSKQVSTMNSTMDSTTSDHGDQDERDKQQYQSRNISLLNGQTREKNASRPMSHMDDLDALFPTSTPSRSSILPTQAPAIVGPIGSGYFEYEFSPKKKSVGRATAGNPITGKSGGLNGGLLEFADTARQQEERLRVLESENFDLKLKLQKTREINAGSEEFLRVSQELKRAERRIVQLETALDRKNEEIKRLSSRADELQYNRQEISQEAQARLDELQSEVAAARTQIAHFEQDNRELTHKLQDVVQDEEAIRHRIVHPTLVRLSSDDPDHFEVPDRDTDTKAAVEKLISGIDRLTSDWRAAQKSRNALSEISHELNRLHTQLNPDRKIDLSDPESYISVIRSLATQASRVDGLEHTLRSLRGKLQLLEDEHGKVLQEMDVVSQEAFDTDRLRKTLKVAQDRISELESHETHQAHQQNAELLAQYEDQIREMDEIIEHQHAASTNASNQVYNIIKSFFLLLNEKLGPEFKHETDNALARVVADARKSGESKVPMLSKLLLKYTGILADDAQRARSVPELEVQIVTLRQALKNGMDKVGADRVLLALNRDLEYQLKIEREKRQTDFIQATRAIDRLSRGTDASSSARSQTRPSNSSPSASS